jgi:hypothetical protein
LYNPLFWIIYEIALVDRRQRYLSVRRNEEYDWLSSHDSLPEAHIFFRVDMACFQFLNVESSTPFDQDYGTEDSYQDENPYRSSKTNVEVHASVICKC